MNKEEFLTELSRRLSGLPESDIRERVEFYKEMIEDHVEDGISEEEAVAEIGDLDRIADQIMSEIPLTKIVKERVKPKRKLKAWEIVLLVLGSPVWVPLILAAAVVVLSVYVVIWAVVVCFYAVDISLAAGAVLGVFTFVLYLKDNLLGAAFSVGAGFACAGLAILMFFGCVWITKNVARLTGKMILKLKASFVRKER